MQWFVDAMVFFFENIHIFALIFTGLALIFLFYVLSIEIKARYYLAIKTRMSELEKDKK